MYYALCFAVLLILPVPSPLAPISLVFLSTSVFLISRVGSTHGSHRQRLRSFRFRHLSSSRVWNSCSFYEEVCILSHIYIYYGKRSFQSQEGGGVWGGGIWKFKLRKSCGNPPFFLHQSTPNVPIRRNVKKKQPPKLKFLK